MRKNQRKIEALRLLRNAREEKHLDSTYYAIDIASEMGISRNSASNLLRRLWKQGLARRKREAKQIKYWISKKGLDRLNYWRRQRIRGKMKELRRFTL